MEKFSSFYENLLQRSTEGQFAKRMVVFDGLNLLHSVRNAEETTDRNNKSVLLRFANFLPVVRFFAKRGHAVNIVIRDQSPKFASENSMVFKALRKFAIITEVPARVNDDVAALTIAHDNCGTVLSRDKFRDHMMLLGYLRDAAERRIELHFQQREEFYENSRGDLFFKANFDLSYLCRRLRSDQVFSCIGDEDYDIVRNSQWSEQRRKDVIQMIDEVLYKLADGQKPLRLGVRQLGINEDSSASDHSSSEENHPGVGFEIAHNLTEAELAVAEFAAPEPSIPWALAASAFAMPVNDNLIDFDEALDNLQGEFNREEIDLAWSKVLPYERTLKGVRRKCESLQLQMSPTVSCCKNGEKKTPRKKAETTYKRTYEGAASSSGLNNNGLDASFQPNIKTFPELEQDLLDFEVQVLPCSTADLLDSEIEDDMAWTSSSFERKSSRAIARQDTSLFLGHPHAEEKEHLFNTLRDEFHLDGNVLYEVLYSAQRLDRNQLINDYFDRLNSGSSNQNSLSAIQEPVRPLKFRFR